MVWTEWVYGYVHRYSRAIFCGQYDHNYHKADLFANRSQLHQRQYHQNLRLYQTYQYHQYNFPRVIDSGGGI